MTATMRRAPRCRPSTSEANEMRKGKKKGRKKRRKEEKKERKKETQEVGFPLPRFSSLCPHATAAALVLIDEPRAALGLASCATVRGTASRPKRPRSGDSWLWALWRRPSLPSTSTNAPSSGPGPGAQCRYPRTSPSRLRDRSMSVSTSRPQSLGCRPWYSFMEMPTSSAAGRPSSGKCSTLVTDLGSWAWR